MMRASKTQQNRKLTIEIRSTQQTNGSKKFNIEQLKIKQSKSRLVEL